LGNHNGHLMKKDFHETQNPAVDTEEIWNRPDITLIDVRSPLEFDEGHISGAVNIPLLDNTERKIVGILYKQYGHDKAVSRGYDILESKLSQLLQHFASVSKNHLTVVYCARGGMRSQVITSFLNDNAFNAKKLVGGYKSFRLWNINRLDNIKIEYPIILHGKTGVGKTLVLNEIENSLDLEGIAQHRGSLFGAVGKNPVSQKTFDVCLLNKLEELDLSRPVFIEGESRKIGNVMIPNNVFRQMKSGTSLLLEASIKTRVARTIDEYIIDKESYYPKIRDVIKLLERDLGNKNILNLLEQFDSGDYQSCFEYILLNYYDKKYGHSMKQLTFHETYSTENVKQTANKIQQYKI